MKSIAKESALNEYESCCAKFATKSQKTLKEGLGPLNIVWRFFCESLTEHYCS
jgi:hypothetical protein